VLGEEASMPDESENSVSAPVCGVAQLGRPRVVAVVVTYNRQDLLPITLAGIAAGQVVPDALLCLAAATVGMRMQKAGLWL